MTVGDILLVPLHLGLAVLLFLISPLTSLLVYFFDLTINILQLPLWLVQKVEVLYIYLGIAALAGLSLGLVFSFFSSFIFSTLSLDHSRLEVETSLKHSSVPSDKTREAFQLKDPSFRPKGTRSKFNIGQTEVETFTLSPTTLSPDLISPMFRGDFGTAGRQRIFPIMEEEDEHEYENRGRKGRNKKRL
ncbi:hypothetical protein TWF225_010261 [Orbilia oligospora]|uniref:Uncharacterized protein n=1 Tax=Orbilia oligospora TaxID=2813651 RepID=A0A7C8KB50_ORBOL|nr:hypothetical protein TWF751_002599 [Orbilia oligospora]KAF3193522.1 hypothetical protein TWF225_010261 [Orbilia oligospora]KAF3249688.1 hypothetical protein TWF128_007699 [Orbilia oligospora]KAF3261534.1 hypothetical protein TWF217_004663 [Orbilia oligospora]KAF3298533.1 hypothetical protein TWF132_000336 [Orbilia oligospora]